MQDDFATRGNRQSQNMRAEIFRKIYVMYIIVKCNVPKADASRQVSFSMIKDTEINVTQVFSHFLSILDTF